MANDYQGNSLGSVFRGADGNAYQVVNGRNVRVSQDKLRVSGLTPLTDVIINGQKYHIQDGKVYRVNGQKLVQIINQAELDELDKRFNAEQADNSDKKLNSSQNNNSSIYILLAAVAAFFLTRK